MSGQSGFRYIDTGIMRRCSFFCETNGVDSHDPLPTVSPAMKTSFWVPSASDLLRAIIRSQSKCLGSSLCDISHVRCCEQSRSRPGRPASEWL